jgi:hypothetical protein
MGNCYGKKCNRVFVKEEEEQHDIDNIGTFDPILYDIVKDIRNNCILSEDQIKYINNISKKDMIKIIKLLIFCNYINIQSISIIIDKKSAEKERKEEERNHIELREHQYIIHNHPKNIENINIISQQTIV